MKGIALCRAVLSLACCLLAAGCYSTYRVRPGLDDLYIYAPGQEERSFELERELPYAPGAEGRRLRVSDPGRSLKVWIGPLRVSGKAQVVIHVKPAGYEGGREAIAENFRGFWEGHKAELEGALGAAARDELADELTKALKQSGVLPVSATATLRDKLKLRNYELPNGTPDLGMAQIDLLPGMRLRIEEAMYQRMPGSDTSETGYVSVGPTYYSVTQRPDGKIAFEPFLGRLDQMGASPDIQRGLVGNPDRWYLAGSVIDLNSKGRDFGHYRLIYPKSFPNSRLDSFFACDRVVLVGADSDEGLKWRCGTDLKDEETAGCRPADQRCRFVSRFRGRALVVPELSVSINGEAVWVSVGTTLRNVAEPFRDLSTTIGRRSVKLFRRSSEGLHSPVDLTSAERGGIDPFDLPLLPGDRIVLSGGY